MVGRGWSGDGSVDRREAGAIGVRAAAAAQRTIRAGAERYQRVRDLPKLARLDPAELSTEKSSEPKGSFPA